MSGQAGIGQQFENCHRPSPIPHGESEGTRVTCAGGHLALRFFPGASRRVRRPGRPIPRHLVHHQAGDLFEQSQQLAMIGGDIAKLGELGLDDGMVDEEDVRQRHDVSNDETRMTNDESNSNHECQNQQTISTSIVIVIRPSAIPYFSIPASFA